MISLPINHKTIFIFDHCQYFSSPCGDKYEFDNASGASSSTATTSAGNKTRQQQQQQQQQAANKLGPLSKSLWTVNIESALEFARVVYDLFPDGQKLIRLISSKSDVPLNSWSLHEQSMDFVITHTTQHNTSNICVILF